MLLYNHKRKMTFLNQAPNLRSRLLPLKSSVWPSLVSYIFWNKNHLISEPQAPRLRLVGWELWKRFGAVHPVGADESSESWESYHLLEGKGSVFLFFLSFSSQLFKKLHTSSLCWKDQRSLLIEEAGTKPCNSVSSVFYRLAFIRVY